MNPFNHSPFAGANSGDASEATRYGKNAIPTLFPGANQGQQGKNDKQKPLMGFLYSVSKTFLGESWPLYLGPNTIGRSKRCSIVLNEASVSDEHATINIEIVLKQGQRDGIFCYIQNDRPTFGTLVNGDSVLNKSVECHSGDIITIGPNYELFLILIDAKQLGLEEKEGFTPTETAPVIEMNEAPAVQKGTVNPASSPFANRKPTVYMPNGNKNQ